MTDQPKAPATMKLGPQFREALFARESVNVEARTVTLSFSSEAPVERYYGNEVLGHGASECNLTRLNNKAALLCNHNPDEQIGVVERAWIQDGKGYCEVRFSKGEDGEEYFQDVQDGIRTKVSVGYRVHALRLTGETEGVETYRVTSWEPYEVSLVSIPADDSVGVGRAAAESETEVTITIPETMKRNLLLNADPNGSGGGGGNATPPKIEVNESAIRKSEQTRCAEILAIAGKFSIKPEDSQRFIAEGKGADEFRQFVLENQQGARALKAEDPNLGLNEKEKQSFSVRRAIHMLANNMPLDGLEKEASEAACKRYKIEPNSRGFVIPHDVSSHATRATHIAGTASLGGFAVATNMGTMIEYLRNKTALGQLGITSVNGLVGNVAFPVQTGGATGYWVSETGNITGSNATFGQKLMTPKRVGAQIPFSLQLLAQSSIDMESFVRNELMTVLALKKDLAGFVGTGVAGEPLGLANTTGINATVTYSGAATWDDVVEHETGIAVDNADISTMAFALDAASVGKWKTALKVATYGGTGYLLEGGGENMTANGYRVVRTNQIATAHQSFFGCWDQMLVGSWAGQQVIVDPYGSNATAGTITVTVQELCDFLVRQPLAFNVSTDSAAQ